MVAWLQAPTVAMPQGPAVLRVMASPAELVLGRTALLAVLRAEVEVAMAHYPMLAQGKANTSRRPTISMLVSEEILTLCDREETSLASSVLGACCC